MLIAAAVLASNLSADVARVEKRYDRVESKQLVPLVSEAVHFATYEKNDEAHRAQKAWLVAKARELGFVSRDAGKITEIELPAADADAPVLGLVVHGDVQPVEASGWSFPPFSGRVENGYVLGRGSADDKGPLAQALVAMKALKESGVHRTHTIRLLVGSEEESDAAEMGEYLNDHAAPDYSLVLDSEFPAVVGEKAWDLLVVNTPPGERDASTPYMVSALTAGLAPSIVPDRAEITLKWRSGTADWKPLVDALQRFRMPEGTRLGTLVAGDELKIVVAGRSAHAGVNITGGRNALVALARLMEGRLPRGGADDLLAFARLAGQDLYGTGLGITQNDPLWGRYAVNVATLKPETGLSINLRRTPPRNGEQSKAYLQSVVSEFNQRTGSSLQLSEKDSYFKDEPLAFDPNATLVKRLLDDYAVATGSRAKPAISGGGTYAKRLPNAIAFGMWFPGKPYPGHDVDEKNPIDDLQRGTRVLIRALVDIATGPKIAKPF